MRFCIVRTAVSGLALLAYAKQAITFIQELIGSFEKREWTLLFERGEKHGCVCAIKALSVEAEKDKT